MSWKRFVRHPDIRSTFFLRSEILQLIRSWFSKKNFLEVETPIIVKKPELEPYLNRFETTFVSEDGKAKERCFLRTSPEIEMKKLLAAGFQNIFQITKCFRNGEFLPLSTSSARMLHNPEFTMLEWYRVNADYRGLMDDTEALIRFLTEHLEKKSIVAAQLIEKPWKRMSVKEVFLTFANLDLEKLQEYEDFKKVAIKRGYSIADHYHWDDIFFLIFLNEIEPKLGFDAPLFLYDYPVSQAALAKRKTDDSFFAERFEFYINGVELCNAFSEINDPREQRQRFEADQKLLKSLQKEVYSIDEDFLEALSQMPGCSGNALGIDRLIMVLLGKKSLHDVILFPWS